MKSYRNDKTDKLFNAFLSCKDVDSVANFCRDLMTIDEIEEFSKRFEMAQRLYSGETQRKISKDMEVSITTVTRVNKWLKNGTNGYKYVLTSTNHHNKPNSAGL